jgi:hypothetical protein
VVPLHETVRTQAHDDQCLIGQLGQLLGAYHNSQSHGVIMKTPACAPQRTTESKRIVEVNEGSTNVEGVGGRGKTEAFHLPAVIYESYE